MSTKAAFVTTNVLLACLAGGAIGCGKTGIDFSAFRKNPRGRKTPSIEDQVTMLYLGENADERREGIVLISSHPWGLEEPYLARYAELLRDDGDATVRGAAAMAIGSSGIAKYVGDVAAALGDKSDRVRWDAAAALDRLVGPGAIDPLREHAIDDSLTDVRAACAKALRHYKDKRVEQTLIGCLTDEAFAVRYRAHASLVEIEGRDLGYEPEGWSGRQPVATRPAEKQPRPWWDWLGVTQGKRQ